jgi:hypothetical protein
VSLFDSPAEVAHATTLTIHGEDCEFETVTGEASVPFVGVLRDPDHLPESVPGVVAVIETTTDELDEPDVGGYVTVRDKRFRIRSINRTGTTPGWYSLALTDDD